MQLQLAAVLHEDAGGDSHHLVHQVLCSVGHKDARVHRVRVLHVEPASHQRRHPARQRGGLAGVGVGGRASRGGAGGLGDGDGGDGRIGSPDCGCGLGSHRGRRRAGGAEDRGDAGGQVGRCEHGVAVRASAGAGARVHVGPLLQAGVRPVGVAGNHGVGAHDGAEASVGHRGGRGGAVSDRKAGGDGAGGTDLQSEDGGALQREQAQTAGAHARLSQAGHAPRR